jgi:peroxiredoxin
MTLQQGDRAPDVTLQSPTRQAVRLSDLWREGPLVVAFLRHMG